MPPIEAVKVLVSNMMSVSLSNKGKPLTLRHYDINRAHFSSTVCSEGMAERTQQDSGEERVTAKSRPMMSLIVHVGVRLVTVVIVHIGHQDVVFVVK